MVKGHYIILITNVQLEKLENKDKAKGGGTVLRVQPTQIFRFCRIFFFNFSKIL